MDCGRNADGAYKTAPKVSRLRPMRTGNTVQGKYVVAGFSPRVHVRKMLRLCVNTG
jgi:hypothetical protein